MRRVLLLVSLASAGVLFLPSAAALFPEAQSPVQIKWQELFMTTFWAALAVGVIVEGLLLYILIRFRARKGGPTEGPHIHGNTKLEIAWTIAPALVMGWLLIISYNGLTLTDHRPDPDFTVDVTGSQFSWTFAYPDGNTSIGTMRVEAQAIVALDVTSTDVIHAFAVPQLGVMIDAVPGRTNHFWFQALAPGEYHALCRELCNNEYRAGHGEMIAKVVVFPRGEQVKPYGAPPTAVPVRPPANETAEAPDATVSLSPATAKFKLEPATLEFEKGAKATIGAANADKLPHNLYIGTFDPGKEKHGALWFSPDLGQGENDTFPTEFPNEDITFEMWCDIPGHRDAGMTGTVKIGAGGAPVDAGPTPLLPGAEAVALLLALALLAGLLRRRTA